MTTALIFGSTGTVGSQILATILSSTTYKVITTISRRAPPTQNPKLQTIVEADLAKWGPLVATLSPVLSNLQRCRRYHQQRGLCRRAMGYRPRFMCRERKSGESSGCQDVCLLLKRRNKRGAEPVCPDTVCKNEEGRGETS